MLHYTRALVHNTRTLANWCLFTCETFDYLGIAEELKSFVYKALCVHSIVLDFALSAGIFNGLLLAVTVLVHLHGVSYALLWLLQ